MKGKLLDKPRFYIYKITFETGETYIGSHIEHKENDGYVCSSKYWLRRPDLKIKSREILFYLPSLEQMNAMETIYIMDDKYESLKNINGNYGNWKYNFHSKLDCPWNKGLKMSKEFCEKLSKTQSEPLLCIETMDILENTQENGHYAEAAKGIRRTVNGNHYRRITKEEKENILKGNLEETKKLNTAFLIELYKEDKFYYCSEYDVAFETIDMIAGMLRANNKEIIDNIGKCYKGFTIIEADANFIFQNEIRLLRIKKFKKIFSKIKCIETDEIFDGVKEAEEKYKCGHISSVLNGSRRTAGGYHWERIS